MEYWKKENGNSSLTFSIYSTNIPAIQNSNNPFPL